MRFQKPDNLKVVVYCLLTAATFWLFRALNEEYDTSVRYPIDWQIDQEEFIVVDELPRNIQINVSGLGWNLLRANSGIGLKPLKLSLTEPTTNHSLPGSYFANQVAEELEQLQLNYIIEDSLLFNIDLRLKQAFSIYIDSLHIDLEEGYRIISPISFDTKLVEIEGPSKVILNMPKDTFWVHVIETNIDDRFDNQVPIQIDYPDVMHLTPQTVRVIFEVAKFVNEEVELPINYINKGGLQNIFFKDSLITLHYTIQENLKDSLKSDSLTVIADFKSFNKVDSTLTLTLQSSTKFVIDPYFSFPQVKVYYNE